MNGHAHRVANSSWPSSSRLRWLFAILLLVLLLANVIRYGVVRQPSLDSRGRAAHVTASNGAVQQHAVDQQGDVLQQQQQQQATQGAMQLQRHTASGAAAGKDIHAGPGSFLQLELLEEPQQLNSCKDYHLECPKWALKHGCQRNPSFMRAHCTFSCHACAKHQQKLQQRMGTAEEGLNPAAVVDSTLEGRATGALGSAGNTNTGVVADRSSRSSSGSGSGSITGGVPQEASSGIATAAEAEQKHDPDANDVDLSDVDTYSVGTGAGNELPGLHHALIAPPRPPPQHVPDSYPRLLSPPPPPPVFAGGLPGGEGDVVYLRGRALGASRDAEGLQDWRLSEMKRKPCRDEKESDCANWAARGECGANPDFMATSCAATCNNCKVLWLDSPLATLQLPSGFEAPTIGFGTATLKERTEQAVLDALAAGYRLFDSAQATEWYREADVGKALSTTQISRQQLFLITKVHPRDFGALATTRAVADSLNKLDTAYLDLVLLHYPACWVGLAGCKAGDEVERAGATWKDAWRALEELQRGGYVRSLGVSNFNARELNQLLAFASVAPSALEARCDPFDCPPHLVNAALRAGLAFIAYSPLGAQWAMKRADGRNPVLEHPVIMEWAKELHRSPAQIVLKWALQRGAIVIPCSSNRTHMNDNLRVHDFVLPVKAMQDISALEGHRPPTNMTTTSPRGTTGRQQVRKELTGTAQSASKLGDRLDKQQQGLAEVGGGAANPLA